MSRLFVSDRIRSPRELWVEVVRAILRHKFLIVTVQILTVFSAYAYVQLLSERYLAETQLLVKLGRQNVDGPATAAKGVVTTMGVREEEINSNISLLSSRRLVEEVVDEIGLDQFASTLPEPTNLVESIKYGLKKSVRFAKDQLQEALIATHIEKRLTPRETIVLYCHKKLTVQRVKSSDVIQVLMWMPSPDLAVTFEETLVRQFLRRHVEARASEVSEDFFATQEEAFRAQMENLEQKLVDVVDGEQLALVDRQRDLLLTRLLGIQQLRDECQNELELLTQSEASRAEEVDTLISDSANDKTIATATSEDTLHSPSPGAKAEMIASSSISELKDRIVQLHLDKSRVVTVEGQDAPSIQAIDAQLRRCESQLQQALLVKIEQHDAIMSEITSRLSALNEGERLVNELTRERDLAERHFLNYRVRREDSRISQALDRGSISNVSVLTPPIASSNPIYPKKKTIILISIVAGLVIGIGFALILEYLDDKVHSPLDSNEYLGWEVLGNVQLSADSGRDRMRNLRPSRSAGLQVAGRN